MDRFRKYSDAELLERTGREPAAFEAFYLRYERVVLGFLIARTRSAEVATDLAAETFAGALEAAGRFDPNRLGGTNALPWILAIARNTLSASLRRGIVADEARRRLECEPVELDDAALAQVEEIGGDGPLVELLRELPAHLQEALTARVLEEREYPQIAAELECSELVVRKRVSRGLSRLREGFVSSPNA
jgi:RNA polymerase sigma factor (sigma-70 family)